MDAGVSLGRVAGWDTERGARGAAEGRSGSEAWETLGRSRRPTRLYLDPMDEVSRIFANMNLLASPDAFLGPIRSVTMSLKFCAAMVDRAEETA